MLTGAQARGCGHFLSIARLRQLPKYTCRKYEVRIDMRKTRTNKKMSAPGKRVQLNSCDLCYIDLRDI